jgi:two-component system, cell cycle sensor histidine kinase and response regulator CckA
LIQTTQPSPPPKKKIRVLLLEDRATDAELIVRELRRANFDPEWTRVETEGAFVAHLDPTIDVVLADYNLPLFNGLQALGRLQELKLDIPFILISGALGDELVAQCIKQGVTDYLLKDRLDRLGLAISHALEERRLRAEHTLVEEQLRQSQKMEAVGQLAGGVAHDFNNLLTVIIGYSGMMLDDASTSEETREAAKQIYLAGQRAGSLTRQLLFFSRKRPIERALMDLNTTVEEVAAMLKRLIGAHIDLQLKLAGDLPRIEADASMMEQVLINLSVNARDAMPEGGKLTIGTVTRELRETDLRGNPDARPGRFVCLRVEDTGSGIPPEIMPRIFEPFFTTKEVGKGTGLGLATIFGIVKQHHGWVEVESQVGKGTSFSILLPVVESSATLPAVKEPDEPRVAGGQETILLVEDETSVREFAVAVLAPLGYRVLQASSGVEALEVWQWHSARINLLVTDVVMPGNIAGPALAKILTARKPGLPVIFTSGYNEEAMHEVCAPNPEVRFLHKPYSPRQLATAVRETLDAKAAEVTQA